MTENIKKLSIMFKEQHASVSWNDIVGFRNRIVHDYGKTDSGIYHYNYNEFSIYQFKRYCSVLK